MKALSPSVIEQKNSLWKTLLQDVSNYSNASCQSDRQRIKVDVLSSLARRSKSTGKLYSRYFRFLTEMIDSGRELPTLDSIRAEDMQKLMADPSGKLKLEIKDAIAERVRNATEQELVAILAWIRNG